MSKESTHFYELSPDLPEFCIPAPQNDYYGGHFVPSVESFAKNSLGLITGHIPDDCEHSATVVYGSVGRDMDLYRRNAEEKIPHDYLALSHLAIDIAVPGVLEEDPFDFMERIRPWWYSSLHETLSGARGTIGYTLADDSAPEAVKLKAMPRGIPLEEAPLFKKQGNKEIAAPNIQFMDKFLARAYMWLPGPERKDAENPEARLQPVHSPRSKNVLMLNSVRIEVVPELAEIKM